MAKKPKSRKTKKRLTPKRFFILGAVFTFLLLIFYFFWDLPTPQKLISWPYPVSTQILDRNNQLLYEIYLDQNRTPINITEMPPYVKWATISAEDKDFYKHHGLSVAGISRAVYSIVFRQKLQGGSTMTQQLVKSALLTPERTIRRKIRELVLTLAVEIIYPKDKILEMYLNHIPYGGTAWGIESASGLYFGKKTKDLTLAEASMLAGLTASPTRYSPFGAHPELAFQRQAWVLERMVEDKHINQQEADTAKKQALVFAPQQHLKAPHFVMYVKEQLVEKYGQRVVEQGGLRVRTTLDLELQNFAQGTIATEVGKLKSAHVTNGAALVTNPKTGEILTMIGSKDYFDTEGGGNFNVTTASRQPGSSIKPINYALGLLNHKINLASVFNDEPTCFKVVNQPLYCPGNYDNTFRGPIQARFALGNSINIPAVKVLALNSLEEFILFANKMGLTTLTDPKNYGLSLTLGGGEVRMVDMAAAFGVFANLGVKQNLVSILKVEDYTGKVLEETEIIEGERIIPMEVAYLISHTLLDNNARSMIFGPSSYLNIKNHPEVSVKTGTTNDKRDNWAIGYNPSYLVTVWVGNNDNKPMSAVASGVTGASPVWNKIITYALRNSKQEWPLKPEGIVGASVCGVSGKLPNPANPCPTRFEYFIDGTIPTEIENLSLPIEIDKSTGQIAAEKTAPENREPQQRQVIYDPLNTPYCLDCPPPTDPTIINYQALKNLQFLTPTP